jgi:hypothetical protein
MKSLIWIIGAALLASAGCNGKSSQNSGNLEAFIAQLQSMPPSQAHDFAANHEDEVRAALADPKLKNKYLQTVMSKMPPRGAKRTSN